MVALLTPTCPYCGHSPCQCYENGVLINPFRNATCGDPGPGNQGIHSRRMREAYKATNNEGSEL